MINLDKANVDFFTIEGNPVPPRMLKITVHKAAAAGEGHRIQGIAIICTQDPEKIKTLREALSQVMTGRVMTYDEFLQWGIIPN